jgi:hypothetical protein
MIDFNAALNILDADTNMFIVFVLALIIAFLAGFLSSYGMAFVEASAWRYNYKRLKPQVMLATIEQPIIKKRPAKKKKSSK